MRTIPAAENRGGLFAPATRPLPVPGSVAREERPQLLRGVLVEGEPRIEESECEDFDSSSDSSCTQQVEAKVH